MPRRPAQPRGFQFRLGRRPKRVDPRTLKLGKYAWGLPAPPATALWQEQIPLADLPMDGNDTLGDCVPVAAAHADTVWTYNASGGASPFVPTAAAVEALYESFTGGQDDGMDLLTLLKAWRAPGLNLGGSAPRRIGAFAEFDLANLTLARQCVANLGVVYSALNIPDFTLQSPLSPWTLPSGAPPPADPSNGHCVPIVGYDQSWFYIATWGEIVQASPEYVAHYFAEAQGGEAYGLVSTDWLANTGLAPSGLDVQQLQADLAAITGAGPPPSSCPALLEQAERDLGNRQVVKGVEDLLRYVECVTAGGTAASHADHAALLERLRRKL